MVNPEDAVSVQDADNQVSPDSQDNVEPESSEQEEVEVEVEEEVEVRLVFANAEVLGFIDVCKLAG